MRKLNCWEIKKCGREPGGEKTRDNGVCPVAVDQASNGLNGGKNGGRICWAIAGTLCRNKVHGYFAQQTASCVICDVFRMVKEEEGTEKFILLITGKPYQPSHR